MRQLEFHVLRYTPDAVKQECVNVGVLLIEPAGDFSAIRFTRDWSRVTCIDPDAEIEVLEMFEADLGARLASGKDARVQTMKLIGESFSNQLQVSERSACLAASPEAELDMLAKMYLEPRPKRRESKVSPRERIYDGMRAAFEQEGIWDKLVRPIRARNFTHPGDPLKIDCGYQPNGFVRMFHAVSLEMADSAKALAFSYPQLAVGVRQQRDADLRFTAVIESDQSSETSEFARSTLEQSGISLALLAEMPAIAERARKELMENKS